jgi:LuxR family maltose regulon positive regulatory protein
MANTLSPFHHWFYLLVTAEIHNSKGTFNTAMEYARQAIDMAHQIGLDDCSSIEIYAETLRLTGDNEAAIHAFRQTLQLCREQNNALMEAFSVFHLANTLYQQGQYNDALLVCEDFAGQMTDETGVLHPLAGYGLVPMGQLYYEANQLEQAAYCLENGNRLVRELGMLKPVIQSVILQARLAFLNGDMDGTCRHLFLALDSADSLNHLEYNLLVAAEGAELELRMGNQAACERWLRSVQVDLENYSDSLHEPLRLVYARLLIAKGELQKAGNVLQQLEEAAQSHHRVGVLIKIFILQARNFQLFGNFPQAFECLEKAVLLAAPINHLRSFLDQDADLLPLLAVIQNAAPIFIDKLIEEFSKSARLATRISSDFLAQFSERENEIINLLVENRTNKEIAQRLFITVGTTKWYLNNIFRKMMVKNRKEAVSLLEKIDLEKNRNRLT